LFIISACRRYETQLATPVYSKHKINYAKTIVQAQSDDYENFELGKTNAALLKKFVLSTKLVFADFLHFTGILYISILAYR
jgi:hypothetical protein